MNVPADPRHGRRSSSPAPRRPLRFDVVIATAVLAMLVACTPSAPRPIDHEQPSAATRQRASDPQQRLRDDIHALASQIGERNTQRPAALQAAAQWVSARFSDLGLAAAAQRYAVDGVDCENLEAVVPGARDATVTIVLGAHYDTARGTPGADDNATGVALLMELASRFAEQPAACSVRFVAFVNEEPPYFATDAMGSRQFAALATQRQTAPGLPEDVGPERIVAVISLESLGYYDATAGSQQYPPLLGALYPDVGDFVAVVGNLDSRELVASMRAGLERHGTIPVQSIAAPAGIPGIDWSDHASFWDYGIPAIMITDTAAFRNPHYHEPTDTPDRLDLARIAQLADTIEATVREHAVAATE